MAQSPLLAPPAEIDLIHDDDTPMVSLAKTSWADTLPAFAEASSALGEDAVLPEWPESSHGYAGVSVGVVASTPSKAAAIDVDELYPDGCLSTSLPANACDRDARQAQAVACQHPHSSSTKTALDVPFTGSSASSTRFRCPVLVSSRLRELRQFHRTSERQHS